MSLVAKKSQPQTFGSLRGKVALLIGAYRCESTIEETLASLKTQGPGLQALSHVLVSDDAGGDRTNEISLQKWGETTPLQIRKCVENMGEYRSCNEIINALPASVEWLLIMHGDNLAKPGWLDALLSQLEQASSSLATLSTNWDNLTPDGTLLPAEPEANQNYREFQGSRETVRDTLRKGCWWHISSCAIRVAAYKSVGGMPANGMRHKGDWYLLTKFLDHGWSVGYIPQSLMIYRQNPVGSSSLSYQKTGDVLETLWVFEQFAGRLFLGEICGLYATLAQNIIHRAGKALLTLHFTHFLNLAARLGNTALSFARSLSRPRALPNRLGPLKR